jgi:hypothetical protein
MRTLLLSALFLAPTARADTLGNALKDADAAFRKGDTEKALKLADEIVQAHPSA